MKELNLRLLASELRTRSPQKGPGPVVSLLLAEVFLATSILPAWAAPPHHLSAARRADVRQRQTGQVMGPADLLRPTIAAKSSRAELVEAVRDGGEDTFASFRQHLLSLVSQLEAREEEGASVKFTPSELLSPQTRVRVTVHLVGPEDGSLEHAIQALVHAASNEFNIATIADMSPLTGRKRYALFLDSQTYELLFSGNETQDGGRRARDGEEESLGKNILSREARQLRGELRQKREDK